MVYALRVWQVKRRVVDQQSVDYESPPVRYGSWPQFKNNQEREAWVRREYFEYPKYVALILEGARDFAND